MAEEEKKYTGYGYHGGGRKKMSESGRKVTILPRSFPCPPECPNMK